MSLVRLYAPANRVQAPSSRPEVDSLNGTVGRRPQVKLRSRARHWLGCTPRPIGFEHRALDLRFSPTLPVQKTSLCTQVVHKITLIFTSDSLGAVWKCPAWIQIGITDADSWSGSSYWKINLILKNDKLLFSSFSKIFNLVLQTFMRIFFSDHLVASVG